MEAILAYLNGETKSVMEVVNFFFDRKVYSEATAHLYLMQLQEQKWVTLTVDKTNRRRKAVKMTAKAQNYLKTIQRHWQA